MWLSEWLDRNERQWTIVDGCHVRWGDVRDDVADQIKEQDGLFTLDEVSAMLMGELDPVLLKDNGESDRKIVNVVSVREALRKAGL